MAPTDYRLGSQSPAHDKTSTKLRLKLECSWNAQMISLLHSKWSHSPWWEVGLETSPQACPTSWQKQISLVWRFHNGVRLHGESILLWVKTVAILDTSKFIFYSSTQFRASVLAGDSKHLYWTIHFNHHPSHLCQPSPFTWPVTSNLPYMLSNSNYSKCAKYYQRLILAS